MYSLDIETLISVLQNRHIQGFLEADLSTGGASGALKRGFVKVELREGKIVSILISDTNGRILYQGQDALNKVRRMVLTWQLTETPSRSFDKDTNTDPTFPIQRSSALQHTQPEMKSLLPPVDRSSASNTNNAVPVRLQSLLPGRLRYLSRSARTVYALVNGANSIQRIANLLSMPTDMVYRELLALQREQLVSFRDDEP